MATLNDTIGLESRSPLAQRSGAGVKVTTTGAMTRFDLDYGRLGPAATGVPPTALVAFQDPDTGAMRVGPAASIQAGSVAGLSLKGNLTPDTAATQDVRLADLAAAGNPLGDAVIAAAKTALLPNINLTGVLENGFYISMGANRGPNMAASLGFGGGFYAANHFDQSSSGAHAGETRATWGISRTPIGSGANGPANADIAMMLGTVKANYLTSQVVGELDGMYVSVKQGAQSDLGGILIDARKVHNLDGNDTGGTVAIETTTAKLDSLGNVRQAIQAILGFGEGDGGPSSGTGHGAYVEAQVGAPYAAYYAGNLSPGQWRWAFAFHASRSPSSRVCGIDGAGHARMSFGSAPLPSYSFEGDEDTGVFRPGPDALAFATGGANRWYIDSNGHFSPGFDNTNDIGGVNRVRNFYLAGSTLTSSSDKRLKLEIEPSPLGLDFIKALAPKSYRVADGGTALVDQPVQVDVEVPVLDKDGNEIFDPVPQFEADGVTPIWDKAGTPSGLLDARGNPIMKRRQLVVAIKRMQTERQTVMRPQRVEAPGQRRHFGFLAQDVRAALVDAGQPEAAIWTLENPDDPESRQGLRYEQFVAPLTRAVQELAGQVAALAARVVALEAARP